GPRLSPRPPGGQDDSRPGRVGERASTARHGGAAVPRRGALSGLRCFFVKTAGVSAENLRVVESAPVADRHGTTFPVKRSRRYTIVIADRRTGAYRRFGIRPVPVATALVALFLLPILIGLGMRWSAVAEIEMLRADAQRLELENRNFRAATGELTTQLQSLQAALGDLRERTTLDPDTARAMRNLPAIVKSRAAGGPILGLPSTRTLFSPNLGRSPEDTFGTLRDLL